MHTTKSKTTVSGTSTLGLLGVVFVTLKLCKVINWSWWWVTSPFWGPWVLVLGFAALILCVAASSVIVSSAVTRISRLYNR